MPRTKGMVSIIKQHRCYSMAHLPKLHHPKAEPRRGGRCFRPSGLTPFILVSLSISADLLRWRLALWQLSRCPGGVVPKGCASMLQMRLRVSPGRRGKAQDPTVP